MTKLLFGSILVLALAPLTPPAQAADAVNGRTLAIRWCATCHLVAPNQQRSGADAAPFDEIAKQPDFDANRLAFFLLEPHPKMPSMSLSRIEAGDLAAYIGSLRK